MTRDIEGPIHKAILRYLAYAMPGAWLMHPANELALGGDRRSKAIAQAKAKSLGMLPGAPDIIALWHGNLWAFEVKAPGNYPTETQRECGEHIERMGGRWAVVRSVDQAAEKVAAWMHEAPRAATVEIRGTVNG